MASIDTSYHIILNSLKEKIRLARQKAAIAVNTELLAVYWEIGYVIAQQETIEGWGAKTVEKLSKDLKTEFPDMKGLSPRNLRYMRDFAIAWPGFSILQEPLAKIQATKNQPDTILQAPLAKLTWYHHITILDKIKDTKIRLFYIGKAVENGWSRNVMLHQIESQLHLRQGNAITNFKSTLPAQHSDLAREMFKNPYLFDFLNLGEEAKERELENALIQNLKKFLLELGRGFAYVGNQFHLEVGGDDFFPDLLFYNTRLHCYVVFELKVSEFKPEFAGKLNFYLNAIDAQIKTEEDKPTIGILLCKTPNETIIEYALRGIDKPMGVADFELKKFLPDALKTQLPTIEELKQEILREVEEFKDQVNPIDARLQAIKERLKGVKTDEIQTPVTYSILLKLYNESLKPLYIEIINRLEIFNEEFHTKSYGWRAGTTQTDKLNGLEPYWHNESNLKTLREVEFNYNLLGFKKAGTENFSEHLTLKFEMQEYWYGFTLINYNNHQPFIKKLYHQPITKEDQQQVIDLMMTKVMDRIEWILEFMKNKEEKEKM